MIKDILNFIINFSAFNSFANLICFAGYGSTNVNGGNSGGPLSGGGAAGRIAIDVKTRAYRGVLLAQGGSSPGGFHGGPGTIYITEVRSKRAFTQLIIDNIMNSVQNVVTIHEDGRNDFAFSEVQLWRRASISMSAGVSNKTLIIESLKGDRTGLIHALANHSIQLEASDTAHSVSKPPVNLRIDKGSEIFFGNSLYIIGDGAKGLGQIPGDFSLSVDGRLTGITYLFLTKKLKAKFSQNVQTAENRNGTIVPSEVGKFTLAVLELQDGTELLFDHSSGMNCLVGKIHMKYGAKLRADSFDVGVTTLLLESGSTMTSSGKDRPNPNIGPTLSPVCRSSGGSHASDGGKGNL